MARQVQIKGELGTLLIQCCLTAGDYAACAEILRFWNPIKENVEIDYSLKKKLLELF